MCLCIYGMPCMRALQWAQAGVCTIGGRHEARGDHCDDHCDDRSEGSKRQDLLLLAPLFALALAIFGTLDFLRAMVV